MRRAYSDSSTSVPAFVQPGAIDGSAQIVSKQYTPAEPEKASQWRWKTTGEPETHPDDVPDPHELDPELHHLAYRYLQEATAQLADLLDEVLRVG